MTFEGIRSYTSALRIPSSLVLMNRSAAMTLKAYALATENHPSIPVSSRVILRTNNQTPSLLRTAVNRLNDVDELLLVFENPIQLVVVAGAEIAHHVLVAEEEHHGACVVEFVHGFEVGDFV